MKSIRNRIVGLIVFVFAVSCGNAVWAAEDVAELFKKKSESNLEQRLQKKVSVDFNNIPIDDVLRSLAKQADLDMVKGPSVVGNVTATFTDIPLAEALENILTAYGFAYIPSENMIRIVPRSEVDRAEEKLVSKVYRITYANAAEVVKSLDKFLTKRGELAYNAGTSNIMVTDTETKIKALDDFIMEIDRVTPQVLVEVRIYDFAFKDRIDIGVNWSAGRYTTFDDSGNPTGGRLDPFGVASFNGPTTFTEAAEAAIRVGVLNESISVDGLVRMEEEGITAKLLANPRIMVLDNETANIKIVSEIPYQELTQTPEAGNIGTTEFKEVGVELTVSPHITRDKMIRLHVNPKFSVQTGEISITLAGANITSPQPIVDSREAETITLVEDGHTVVLGGLRKQDTIKQVNKVPFLGDIPLLGALFRFEGKDEVTNELVVFLTPRIVHEPVMTEREARQLDETEFDLEKLDKAKEQQKVLKCLGKN